MTPFVNKTEKPNRVVAHFVVEVKRKRLGPTAGKTMRAGVITAAPANDFARLSSHPLAQFAGQSFGDFAVSGLGFRQVGLEAGTENGFHAGDPKTCSKFSPESFPETKSAKRRFNSAVISASERWSFSRLWISNFARSARSAGDSESASSATARWGSAMGQQ